MVRKQGSGTCVPNNVPDLQGVANTEQRAAAFLSLLGSVSVVRRMATNHLL